jgi:hypothetical protein
MLAVAETKGTRMSEIGALIIRLQAETAQFREDMGKVKADLDGLKGKSKEFDGSFNMMEARGSMMVLEESLGIRLPRHINSLIATIPGIGAAFELLLPVMGAVFAIGFISKFVEEHKKAAKEIADGWKSVDSTFHDTMATLGEELLQVQIKADELGNHSVAALQGKIKLLNEQTLNSIIGEFKKMETEADKLLQKMDSNWFMKLFGSVDTEPAQKALLAVREKLEDIREHGNDPKQAVVALNAAMQEAQGHFDTLREKQRQAAGVIKDSPQDNFLAQHLTDQEKAWQDVTTALREQTIEARERVAISSGKATNEITADAQKTESAWNKAFASLSQRVAKAHDDAQKASDEIAAAQVKATEAVAKLGEQGNLLNQGQIISKYREYLGMQQDALEQNHALGLISEKNYYEQVKKVYEQEHEAKMRALLNEIDQTQDPDKKLHLIQQQTQEQIKFNSEISKTDTAMAKLNSSWGTYFARMKSETLDLSTTIRMTLQSSVTQFVNGFSQGMARSIVESRSLGQAVRQVASQMLESMLSSIIKWGMQWVITHTIMKAVDASTNAMTIAQATATAAILKTLAAQVAGANAVASFSLAPWPIDTGAPAFGATMMATAMSFEIGGKIPGQGAVPIIGHGGETVVTKALTDRVEANEGRNGNSYGDTHVHASFAPTIHAMDAEGVDRMLTKHGDTFKRHMTSVMRRMNK